MIKDTDILIVGGGPIGLSLAVALEKTSHRVLLLEANQQIPNDPRALAISHGSRLSLENLTVWDKIPDKTPITKIHVSTSGYFGRTIIQSKDLKIPALGYVISYSDLAHSLYQKTTLGKTIYISGAKINDYKESKKYIFVNWNLGGKDKQTSCKLLVIADGGKGAFSGERKTIDYNQYALLATAFPRLPQEGIAFERFLPTGPIALLPQGLGYSLVWTGNFHETISRMEMSDGLFQENLEKAFGGRCGSFLNTGKRSYFHLQLSIAKNIAQTRTIKIGNSAQTIHPVGGQGFNLGLRDSSTLADHLGQANDPGENKILQSYLRKRAFDVNFGIKLTDNLARNFATKNHLLTLTQSLGLSFLDLISPIKKEFAQRMIYGTNP